MSWILPLRSGLLAVGEHPDVGGDAGVVEELIGQGHDGFQPVVFDDPLADVAFAAARIAGEQWRAVEDNADAAAAVLGAAHFGNHVLEKEEGAVVDARQPGAEAALIAQGVVLLLDVALLLLPLHAKGRVGQHVVEGDLLPSASRSKPSLVKVSPSRMLSASSPLMSMSDLQTAQASSFQSWPNSSGLASALRCRM